MPATITFPRYGIVAGKARSYKHVGIREDENDEPLSIGRRSRSIPPPMRRCSRQASVDREWFERDKTDTKIGGQTD